MTDGPPPHCSVYDNIPEAPHGDKTEHQHLPGIEDVYVYVYVLYVALFTRKTNRNTLTRFDLIIFKELNHHVVFFFFFLFFFFLF